MSSPYFLEMTNISKTFPGAKVLDRIDIRVKPGEVRALMGENGAGKSTLIKILGGIYSMDPGDGEIRINGEPVKINSVQDAKANGISIIHQEISLADNMTVFDNLFMGAERMKTLFIDDKRMIREAQQVIDDMDMQIDVRSKVSELSIAKQQMVEITRAIMFNARLIVMDEPTSSLTSVEIEHLFEQIARLKAQGIAIIYISHRMDEIFRIADSISVLRDGHLIGTDEACNLDQNKLVSMMVGREITEVYHRESRPEIGEVALEVKNLKNKYLKDVSFQLRKGEILGFSGLVGAGRSETARAIFGIDPLQSGEISIDGKAVRIRSARDAIANGIGFVPENRKLEGLFLTGSIEDNMTYPVLEKFMGIVGMNQTKRQAIVDHHVHDLAIKMTSTRQAVGQLSGGNQQKVLVSKWLATEPKILILDEPTRGIDVGAKAEIYQLIFALAQKGIAIMLISSEMDEIINLSDRIVVMHEGVISGEVENDPENRASQEEIMWLASGGKK